MLDGPFDPDDGGDMGRPLRLPDSQLGVEHGDRAGFVAVAQLGVDGLCGR